MRRIIKADLITCAWAGSREAPHDLDTARCHFYFPLQHWESHVHLVRVVS